MRKITALVLGLFMAAVVLTAESRDIAGTDAGLYTVGAIGASNLYFSYIVLGTVADSYASERYTAETARTLAEETASLNAVSRDALEQLLTAQVLLEEDQETVLLMIEAHDLLIGQAHGLLSFIDEQDNGEQFQEYRRHAWRSIAVLLGIDLEE